MTLDFSGSAEQHDGNLNCPLAVTRSACLFALRVLTDPDIPPTAGAYRPLELHVPEGCLLNARPGAAVAAGNVETSSRVADLVLSAFGRAQGQGTMNNLTLGNDSFSYYETLGGGQGACADADGPSGVHVAMSNTLNTPIEALEREFPLRVLTYGVRRGSGGEGRHRGGDGVVRELQALTEMSYSLIAERRRHAPAGAEGGRPGARAATCSTASRWRARRPGPWRPGSGYASKPPVGEDSAVPAERIGFLGLGIMGSRMAANVAAAGYPLTVWTHTPGKAERWAAEHGATACATPAEVAAAERDRDQHGRGRRSGRLGADAASRACSAEPPRGCCAWTCRRSGPRTRGRSGRRWPKGRGAARRPRHRLLAAGRGRDAHDHGGRRSRGVRAREAAAGDDGPAGGARRRARAGPDPEGDQQLAGGRQRGGGRRGAAAGRGRRDRPRRAHGSRDGRLGRLRCSWS